jgi:hypothetical protein
MLRFVRPEPKTHRYHITGLPPLPRVARPSSERSSVPNPNQPRSSGPVAADRLRVIAQRLQNHFYEVPPASERIAASVLADLKDLEQSSPALPQ